MNAQLSSSSHNWGTPKEIINRVHDLLGGIDLDPASSPYFNQTVQADRYLTEHDDGLLTEWATTTPITVFCNPPGGKYRNQSMTKLFWDRLISYRQKGLIIEAVFVAFSIESLAVTQSSAQPMTDFPVCIPSKRIKFDRQGEVKVQPTHSNAIIYVPGTDNDSEAFYRNFISLGSVVKPYRCP